MASYRQYCPIARATEILAERWNLLIVRNLMFGADTFSAIAQGVPTMSRSMLVKRLRELEQAGVITSRAKPSGQGSTYELTEAGADLVEVIDSLGRWAEEWIDVLPEHADPGFALWAWCMVQLNRDALPPGRVVVAFGVSGRAGRQPVLLAPCATRHRRGLRHRSRRRAGSPGRRSIQGVRRLAPRRPGVVGGDPSGRHHPHRQPFTRSHVSQLEHPHTGSGVTGSGVEEEHMSAVNLDREAWLAAKPVRNPDAEQALFSGDVPGAADLSIDEINPLNPHLFREDRWHEHFARLRREDPVHFNELGSAGRYWSVTTYDVKAVDGDWRTFSSARGITIGPPVGQVSYLPPQVTSFIAMDPPEQTRQRKTVRGISAPGSLRAFEALIRERTAAVLDSLPVGETFDWVEAVSVELTTLMLATLFGFPLADRTKLTRWSDVVTTIPEPGGLIESNTQRQEEMAECLEYFERLWVERRDNPGHDLVSMLAHGEATRHMPASEHLGNLILLIVGGNDTTRNTMSGSVYGLNTFPGQYDRLIADPGLIPALVPEVIRWQTPLAYMRRTATHDCELGGKQILKDDQVLMWYVSANRDRSVFGDDADELNLRRANAERHLSFGYGVHFCMGSRLAELQLRVLWEEILSRFGRIEVQEEPERTFSSFVHGYTRLPVRITRL